VWILLIILIYGSGCKKFIRVGPLDYNGDNVKKYYLSLLIVLFLTGCSTAPHTSSSTARLIGVSIPAVPVAGPIERVYFTSVDGVERKSILGGYSEKLEIGPGDRMVVVVCEWRPTTTAPPTTRNVQRVEGTFKTGHVYKFTSTLEQSGGCLISHEDVTQVQSN
jgi:hypothetical protein